MKAASTRLLNICSALVLMATATAISAQEVISLSDSEMRELAILFAPASPVGNTDGERVPATVIASPEASNTVHSWFEGVLSQWHVAPGDSITTGTRIATLRSEELLTTQQELLRATIAQESAEAVLRRDQNLFDAGVIAEARLTETRRQHQQAIVTVSSIRQRLLSAGIAAADIDTLVGSQQATGTYTLRAGQTGRIVRRLVQAGDYIADGSAVAVTADDDLPWLSAQVPAYLVGELSPGQSLRVVEQGTELTLRQVDQQIDPRSQTISVLAQFAGASNWVPGQTLTLILPPANGGIRIPSSAVVFNGADTTVYVRRPGGVESRTLALETMGRNYLAASGISAGEEIVIQGAAVLKGIQLGLGGTQ
ncbi:efflux RND transporter periplasmic adaptor subunit [Pseudohongiella sp.]|uniref:Uncharacterized protein n=1 Tax=marine sediment metagenome TaxID=412755 RepID=A0A0F9WEK3_9ZZZZ|nr:efflux RND transporter periplasmic adaptor subunit [Pseudohongiella sp.]HDZ08331.1 HlyD family efflux transporter periplasmic adaptor subunit [Pseudohongiella sp.]HEA62607.1 HlyD family efflux transporter periplasmic adaptor subunit [Pseudohongiella sp.]